MTRIIYDPTTPMWWGYLHANGHPQLKRWRGDHKDYTDDCKDNPFTVNVIEPFEAPDWDKAMEILIEKLHI